MRKVLLLGLLTCIVPSFLSSAFGETNASVGGVSYMLLRSNLHVHTGYSTGGGDHLGCLGIGPEGICASAKRAGMDVVGFSDHCFRLTESQWQALHSVRESQSSNHGTIVLPGFEWTHESSYVGAGKESLNEHINVFDGDAFSGARTFLPIYARSDGKYGTYCPSLSDLYNQIWKIEQDRRRLGQKGLICQFNHPGICQTKFDNFRRDDRMLEAFALIEVWRPFAANNWDGEEWYRTALRNGWRVAPTAGIDNQDGACLRMDSHYTGIWAAAATRGGVLEALRNRRVFATGCQGLSLRLMGNYGTKSYLMGDTAQLPQGAALSLQVVVELPAGSGQRIDYVRLVEVRGNNGFSGAAWAGGDYQPEGIGFDSRRQEPYGTTMERPQPRSVTPAPSTVCYYVRVRLTDGEMAISAPIWVRSSGAGGGEQQSGVIFDPLDHDNRKWSTNQWCTFENGAYHFRGGRFSVAYHYSDGLVQIDAQHVSGAQNMPFGICFRMKRRDGGDISGYRMLIAKNTAWKLVRWSNGVNVDLTSLASSSAIKTADGETNQIGVICRGNTIIAMINGQKVGTAYDSTYADGGVGPFSNEGMDIAFRNLKIDPSTGHVPQVAISPHPGLTGGAPQAPVSGPPDRTKYKQQCPFGGQWYGFTDWIGGTVLYNDDMVGVVYVDFQTEKVQFPVRFGSDGRCEIPFGSRRVAVPNSPVLVSAPDATIRVQISPGSPWVDVAIGPFLNTPPSRLHPPGPYFWKPIGSGIPRSF